MFKANHFSSVCVENNQKSISQGQLLMFPNCYPQLPFVTVDAERWLHRTNGCFSLDVCAVL